MRLTIAVALLTVTFTSTSAIADDTSASFLTLLYSKVCVPNVGQDEKIRGWAREKKLAEVTAPAARDIFVGAGDGGVAWAVPMSFGSFALSIRGDTHACATFARAVDPAMVESYFRKILEGVSRPGLVVKVVKDSSETGPNGTIRALIYSVSTEKNVKRGNLYTMVTNERTGGPFQATLQAAKFVESP